MRPQRWQPTRLCHPWGSPGKNIGVGGHFLLQYMKVKSESEVAQSYPTLCDPTDCSLPGASVHGIFQARVLFSSVQFSRSVVSDSLGTHELQYARPPCPSPTHEVHSNSRPSSRWCHPPSHPLSSPSPVPNSSQHKSLFQWVNSSQDNSNAGSPEDAVKATLMTGSRAAGPYEGQ